MSGVLKIEDWLRGLVAERGASPAAHRVVQCLIAGVEVACYASAAKIAEVAEVDVSSVTRASQALGYGGWPALRQEIRARHLGRLSLAEVATINEAQSTGHLFDDVLDRQVDHLRTLRRTMDRRVVSTVARRLAQARRRYVVASGSFAGIGRVLAHNAGLAGYPCELLDEQTRIANTTSGLDKGDLVVCISLWRMTFSTVRAARQARERGATVCVLSNIATSPLAEAAHHLLVVPAEGASIFPSLVPSLAIIDAVLAELAALDPKRTGKAVRAAEASWAAFNLHWPAVTEAGEAFPGDASGSARDGDGGRDRD